ncbi:MAG TPA: hypothetical protein DCM14_06265 [Clostridiales bacterium UBA8153]|nr:hypothetical protein [Clostridiales bacterium UBA8153]
MNRKQAARLTLLSLGNARFRVVLLAFLMITGITGRVLYGHFFGHLSAQAAERGGASRAPVVMVLSSGRDVGHLIGRHAVWHRGTISVISGALTPVFTPVGRLEALALDWAQLTARYPDSLTVNGRLPVAPGEVALPEDLAAASGLSVGQPFLMSGDPTLERWSAVAVVGTFQVNPAGQVPLAVLDRPLLAPWEGLVPNIGVIYAWTVPPARLRAINVAVTSRQLAIQLRNVYREAFPTSTAGFWGWESLPVFISADWERLVTTSLSRDIYQGGGQVLGAGYAFVALGIYSVLVIALMSRRRELAINKTIGLSPRQLVFVFGMEVAVVSLASFTLGTAAVWVLGRRVAEAMGLTAQVELGVLFQTLATMGALVAMASAIPLAMAAAATVNQLLYGQKIYLFKRRVVLRVDGRGDR